MRLNTSTTRQGRPYAQKELPNITQTPCVFSGFFLLYLFLVVFKREKEHEVGGYRISEELENEKIYGKIYCMKISKNT